MIEVTLTAGGLSSLILQGIKLLWRKFVVKDLGYDFPQNFYVVALPVLNVLVVPLMALLLVEGYAMPSDWLSFGRTVAMVFLSSLASLATYTVSVQPLRSYGVMLKARKAKEQAKKKKA